LTSRARLLMRMGKALLLAMVAAAFALAASAQPGLRVREGVLVKDGRPYRAIGANYFSLFSRVLKDPADKSSLENVRRLRGAGIPFVRFMCGGFWPVDMKLYVENRPEYFRRLDLVVRAAEESGVGLIPSLFWYFPTVPDLVGEHLDEYGNPSSKSIEFIRRYTEEVVGRYKDSRAIWGWEFGNECNLDADLPNHSTHRPPAWPNLGGPDKRTERDELKFEEVRLAMVTFATTVRKLDRERIILTGHAVPRNSAWHNLKERSWVADTGEQFGEILLRDNPDPFDTITIHAYPEKSGKYPGGARSIDELIGAASASAKQAGKPLFLGEFGTDKSLGEREHALFEEFLAGIESHQVPLSAFWVFDYGPQSADRNVDFGNERSWMIQRVAQVNAKLAEGRRLEPAR
jgi:hypothetical protein